MNEIKITDKKKRSVLNEGRNNGMGFAFLKKKSETSFITVQPYSPCKDYLNEIVITERYDVGTKGCGLKYPKKLDIFNEYAYLGIKIQKTMNGYYNYSNSYDDDVNKLNTNYKNLEYFIRLIEKDIEIKNLTEIICVENNNYIVKFDSLWVQSTHAISLYSLLLRVGFIYDIESDKDDYIKFLENYNYNSGDRLLIKSSLTKLKNVIDNKKLPPNTIQLTYDSYLNNASPHHYGILSWNNSFEEFKVK